MGYHFFWTQPLSSRAEDHRIYPIVYFYCHVLFILHFIYKHNLSRHSISNEKQDEGSPCGE